MKFGGTSVADAPAIKRLADIVISRIEKKPVVVVSALSKITRTLNEICDIASSGNRIGALELLQSIKNRHIELSNELLAENAEYISMAEKEIYQLTERLQQVLEAVSFLAEVSDMKRAWILSIGEQLSNIIVFYALNNAGIRCNRADARQFIITDNQYLRANADMDMINQKTPPVINYAFDSHDVVLTHGFISSTRQGEPSLLGFEGSDLTATLIGMAMDAEKVEIWTDVDGIQTSDPALIKNTKSISQMSFEVAEELSFFGAKVLHPLTIYPARTRNIPVYVLNSRNPGSSGTMITGAEIVREKGIKSISYKRDILSLTIIPVNDPVLSGFINSVFRVLNRYDLAPDLVSISRENIGMTFENKYNIQKALVEIGTFAQLHSDNLSSQISIVGEGLKKQKGLMKKVFTCMENYTVSMITGGGSENNISFVVEREKLDEIMQLLHDKLFN